MSEYGSRVVFRGGDDCALERFAIPDNLETGQLLIRNEASLVSPGTELAILRKRHRAFADDEPSPWTTFPFYPGYAEVGRVEAVGPAVDNLVVGDRVWHPSPHATVSVVAGEQCLRVPGGIEPRDAVFYGLVEIAMTAIRRAPADLGQMVLVSGLGLVGILVGRLYHMSGAAVAAADFSRGRLRRGADLGFETLIDLNDGSLIDWYAAHQDMAPHLSVEAAGIEANIDACLKVTRPGGRVVLQGSPRKPMEIDPYTDIHRKGLTIIGAHVNTVPRDVRERDVSYLFELCRGALKLEEIRTHELPYAEAPGLYDRLEDSLNDYLGIVLTY
jgi:2-desacetyl-2-hydroxyethyl bacteriochlorophyllide A dehydrogenase